MCRTVSTSTLFLTKDTFYQFPTSLLSITLFHCEKLLRTIRIDNLSSTGLRKGRELRDETFRALPCLVTAGHGLKINSVNLLFLADEKFNIFPKQFSDRIVYIACCYLNTKWKRIGSRFCISSLLTR